MNIYFVGLSGVPYKRRACDTRLLSFAEAFISMGNKVTILNRLPISTLKDRIVEKDITGQINLLELFNVEPSRSLLIQIIRTIYSYPKEFVRLINLSKKTHIDILHLYTGHYIDFVHYYLISKFIGAKVVYQYVEVRSQIHRNKLYHKINGYLCDQLGYKLFNGVIAISTYIENHLKNLSPNLPTIKVPPICNFDYFDSIEKLDVNEPYILYCGSAGYFEVLSIMIDAYLNSIHAKNKFKLKLILNGTQEQKRKIQEFSSVNIDILGELSYNNLVMYYLGASALLIPIRNVIQDIARFPNKICEYTASKGLIITTKYGEIPYYFENDKNALIAKDFSVSAISEQLDIFSEMDYGKIMEIKMGAYQLGLTSFNISVYSNSLNSFLLNLIKK